jgi:quinol monooxygenase YgiN
MIRVIIERKIKPGKAREMWKILRDLRSKSMSRTGYVSGETLVGHDNRFLWVVISTWLKAEYWQVWLNSPERKAIDSREKALLAARVRTTVLEFTEEPLVREEQEEKEEVEAEDEVEQK